MSQADGDQRLEQKLYFIQTVSLVVLKLLGGGVCYFIYFYTSDKKECEYEGISLNVICITYGSVLIADALLQSTFAG
jgi:hypothetical protein